MRPPNSTLRIGGPFRGLDLKSPQNEVAPDSCIECSNVYIDDTGALKTRPAPNRTSAPITDRDFWIAPGDGAVAPYYIESHDMGDVTLIVQASMVYDSGTPANSDSYYSVFYIRGGTNGSNVINWIDETSPPNPANTANNDDWGKLEGVYNLLDSDVLNGVLYIAAGSPANGRKVWIDPAATTADWGEDQREDRLGFADPTGVTTPYDSATTAGPNLTDGHTYRYYVTYYNTETGTESLPVEAGTYAFTTASGNVPAIDANVGSLDTSFNQMRVYRQDDTANDDTAYFIGSGGEKSGFPTLFYYRDTGDDVPNSSPSGRLEKGVLAVPDSDMLCAHKGRMWWRDMDNPSRVWFSEIYEPEKIYPNSSFEAGDEITGLFSAFGYLMVFSKSQVAIITGENASSFNLEVIHASLGCVSNHAIVQLPDGDVIWPAAECIVRYNGSQFRDISSERLGHWRDTLSPFISYALTDLNDFRQGDQRHLTAGVDAERGLVVFNAPDSVTTFVPSSTSTQLVYSYRQDAWTTWDADVWCVGVFKPTGPGVGAGLVGQYGVLASGIGDGILLENRPVILNDDGNANALSWSWHTGHLDFGTSRRKRFYSIDIDTWAYTVIGSADLDLQIILEPSSTGSHTVTKPTVTLASSGDVSRYSQYYDFRRRAERLQLRLSGDYTRSLASITGIAISGNEVEHR